MALLVFLCPFREKRHDVMDEIEWEDASWLDMYDSGHADDDAWQDKAQRKSLKRARKAWRTAE